MVTLKSICLDKRNFMLAHSNTSKYLGLLMIVQVFFSYQGVALGLEPEEILVIANKNIDFIEA